MVLLAVAAVCGQEPPPAFDVSGTVVIAGPSAVRVYDRLYAVVVAVDVYQQMPAEAAGRAVTGAQAVAAALRDRYAFTEIHTLYDGAATREAVRTLFLETLSRVGEGDGLLVYWATRACTVDGTSYLVPYDGDPAVAASNITAEFLTVDVARALAARHILYIIDADCPGILVGTGRASLDPAPRDPAALEALAGEPVRQILYAGPDDGGEETFSGRLVRALEGPCDFLTAGELAGHVGAQPLRGRELPQSAVLGACTGAGTFIMPPRVELVREECLALAQAIPEGDADRAGERAAALNRAAAAEAWLGERDQAQGRVTAYLAACDSRDAELARAVAEHLAGLEAIVNNAPPAETPAEAGRRIKALNEAIGAVAELARLAGAEAQQAAEAFAQDRLGAVPDRGATETATGFRKRRSAAEARVKREARNETGRLAAVYDRAAAGLVEPLRKALTELTAAEFPVPAQDLTAQVTDLFIFDFEEDLFKKKALLNKEPEQPDNADADNTLRNETNIGTYQAAEAVSEVYHGGRNTVKFALMAMDPSGGVGFVPAYSSTRKVTRKVFGLEWEIKTSPKTSIGFLSSSLKTHEDHWNDEREETTLVGATLVGATFRHYTSTAPHGRFWSLTMQQLTIKTDHTDIWMGNSYNFKELESYSVSQGVVGIGYQGIANHFVSDFHIGLLVATSLIYHNHETKHYDWRGDYLYTDEGNDPLIRIPHF
ncbi:MAG: hypothetical protein ABIF71_10745 [Planctomycetota bacterium]